MAKNIYTSKGATAHVDAAGGSTFAQITKVRSVQHPGRSRAAIDVTALDDTSAQSRPGIKQEAQAVIEFLWDDADTVDAAIAGLYDSGVLANWKIAVTDGTTTWSQTFLGWVSNLEPLALGGSDPVAVRCTITVSGAITDAFTP